MTDMDCDVCLRPFNGRRNPICASCAQATLYQPRVLQVTSLLQSEKCHSQAEAILRPGNDGVLAALPDDIDFDAITTGMKKHGHEECQSEQHIVEDRISDIMDKTALLRKQVEEYRSYMTARRQEVNNRRKALAAQAADLAKLKPRMLEPIQTTTRKISQKLDKTTSRIVDYRALLCHAAAQACGLQKRRGARDRTEYLIGNNVIPDLRELGARSRGPAAKATSSARTLAEPHALITASLDDVARLLSITAHYLSVRLPAEIILPHGDFPRCVILPERSSYKASEVRFPGHTSSQSSSPAASRVMDPLLPRPRPLYLDYPLAHLSKEDPKSYGLFVEGVALLAWDLAWLCRTQGIDTINTFEELCMIGKNLWQLVVAPDRKPAKPLLDRKTSGVSDRERAVPTPGQASLGLFSHASASHSLAGAEALELFRDWKLASPARVTDKLKTFLLTEIQGAEWDLLEEQEWEQDRDDELAVLVGGSGRPQESRHPAMSVMTIAPDDDLTQDVEAAASGDRKKGNSGWMKIRGRNEES